MSNRATKSVGTATAMPIFKNLKYPKCKPCSLRIVLHMMPAKAPIGVKKAPMLEPTTVA